VPHACDDFLQLIKAHEGIANVYSKTAYDRMPFHLQDSLNIAGLVGAEVKQVVDFGSGSGFPAVPIAISRPETRVWAVESRLKKCSFLLSVKEKMNIHNLSVFQMDFLELLRGAAPVIECVTAKAFKKPEELIRIFQEYGKIKQMIVPLSQTQVSELPASIQTTAVISREVNGEAFYYLNMKR